MNSFKNNSKKLNFYSVFIKKLLIFVYILLKYITEEDFIV